MMTNNITIYTKKLIEVLKKKNFLDEDDIFMDFDYLESEIEKCAINNVNNYNVPDITNKQMKEILYSVRKKVIDNTINDLLHEDIISITGINENGEFTYTVNT